MRIIEYTLGVAPFRRGGLPRYSTDLSEELAKNNDVYVLYPGANTVFRSNVMNIRENVDDHSFRLFEIINPLPVSLGLGIKRAAPFKEKRNVDHVIKWIQSINPEVIHLHTLMGFPIELLGKIKEQGIKIVYTTHDFYGLCPKMMSEDPKGQLKSRKCTFDCMLCKDGPSERKLFLMQSHAYQKLKDSPLVKKIRQNQKSELNNVEEEQLVSDIEVNERYNLRRYYLKMFSMIDEFHFNSSVSEAYFRQYMPSVKGKIVSITHSGLIDNRKNRIYSKSSNLKIGYIGPYDQKKGFFDYVTCLENVRKKKQNFEAYFYGDIAKFPFFEKPWVHNEGIKAEGEMNDVYQQMDLIVLPSLWHETFGFVVLEAILQGTPCIVAKNVGAKDILSKDCIFNSFDDLEAKIIKVLSFGLKSDREQIKNMLLKYRMDDHAKKIKQLFYKKQKI